MTAQVRWWYGFVRAHGVATHPQLSAVAARAQPPALSACKPAETTLKTGTTRGFATTVRGAAVRRMGVWGSNRDVFAHCTRAWDIAGGWERCCGGR